MIWWRWYVYNCTYMWLCAHVYVIFMCIINIYIYMCVCVYVCVCTPMSISICISFLKGNSSDRVNLKSSGASSRKHVHKKLVSMCALSPPICPTSWVQELAHTCYRNTWWQDVQLVTWCHLMVNMLHDKPMLRRWHFHSWPFFWPPEVNFG